MLKNWRGLLTMLLLVTGLVGLIPPPPVEGGGLYAWWWRYYYSDDTYTELVGERYQLCTYASGWGERTPYIYYEGGSCFGPDPGGRVTWACCYDANGNGVCDQTDPPACTPYGGSPCYCGG
jgi:hypothetical protein